MCSGARAPRLHASFTGSADDGPPSLSLSMWTCICLEDDCNWEGGGGGGALGGGQNPLHVVLK